MRPDDAITKAHKYVRGSPHLWSPLDLARTVPATFRRRCKTKQHRSIGAYFRVRIRSARAAAALFSTLCLVRARCSHCQLSNASESRVLGRQVSTVERVRPSPTPSAVVARRESPLAQVPPRRRMDTRKTSLPIAGRWSARQGLDDANLVARCCSLFAGTFKFGETTRNRRRGQSFSCSSGASGTAKFKRRYEALIICAISLKQARAIGVKSWMTSTAGHGC